MAGVETDFADRGTFGSEAQAFEHGAIGQHQKDRRHGFHPAVLSIGHRRITPGIAADGAGAAVARRPKPVPLPFRRSGRGLRGRSRHAWAACGGWRWREPRCRGASRPVPSLSIGASGFGVVVGERPHQGVDDRDRQFLPADHPPWRRGASCDRNPRQYCSAASPNFAGRPKRC